MISRRKVVTYKGMLGDILGSFLKAGLARGDCVKEFERRFAEYIGVKHAVAVSSGRFGMELLLRCLGLERGDEVMLPAYTFYDLPRIIMKLGLKPVFVDIKKKTFEMNPELIEDKISRKTKVIIATHLFGLACEVAKIKETADRHNIKVIEDCAHAAGVEYAAGRKVGSCGFGGFFSFDTHKPINTLGGGMVVTDSGEAAEEIRRMLSPYGCSFGKIIFKILFSYIEAIALTRPFNFFTSFILHNGRLLGIIKARYRRARRRSGDPRCLFSDIQAMLGIRHLERLDAANIERARIGREYIREIKTSLPDLLNENAGGMALNHNIFLCFVILAEDAKGLSNRLMRYGIDSAFQENVVENCGRLYDPQTRYPVTEFVTERALELPMFIGLKQKQIKYIVDSLKEIILGP